MHDAPPDTTCTNPACPRLFCTGDCRAPVLCTDCGHELTAEEELEERASVRPQCFACIDASWAETEKKIRARTMLPPAPETIPCPPPDDAVARHEQIARTLLAAGYASVAIVDCDTDDVFEATSLSRAS